MLPHLRVARPTDHLDELIRVYRGGLGFAIVGELRGHAGFDGMLGRREQTQRMP